MAPKIVDREERHREILTAALELFIKKGYHQTTLNEIAKASGIGQGTLYYYFPSKEEIFWKGYELVITHIESKIKERLQKCNSPKEIFTALLKTLYLNFPEVGKFDEFAQKNHSEKDPFSSKIKAMGFSRVFIEFWLHAERSGKQEDFYQRIAEPHLNFIDKLSQLFNELGLPENRDSPSHKHKAHLLLALRDGLAMQLHSGLLTKDSTIFNEVIQYISGALHIDFIQEDSSQTKQSEENHD